MARQRRQILQFEERVQREFAGRAAIQWSASLAFVFAFACISNLLVEPDLGVAACLKNTWSTIGSAIVLSLCFLPWVVISNLRMSYRFSGPMSRICRSLQRMRAGQKIPPIRVRRGDLFLDLAEEINSLAVSIDRLETTPNQISLAQLERAPDPDPIQRRELVKT